MEDRRRQRRGRPDVAAGPTVSRHPVAVRPGSWSHALMTDERAGRMAKNEAHFRRINERVKDGLLTAPAELADGEDLVGFVCECSDLDCCHLVYAPASVYRAVREDERRFLVCAGHDEREIEDVVERSGSYSVVEKHGEAGKVAAAE